MLEISAKSPARITVEFASQNTADTDKRAFFGLVAVGPAEAELGAELGDVFVIFEIGPKLDLRARTSF